jgi:hypothetical protein
LHGISDFSSESHADGQSWQQKEADEANIDCGKHKVAVLVKGWKSVVSKDEQIQSCSNCQKDQSLSEYLRLVNEDASTNHAKYSDKRRQRSSKS